MSATSPCPGCRSPIPAGNRFCPECGRKVDPSSALPTEHLPPPSRSPKSDARFIPGAILAGRYRIVGLLGRGGMGEVYRADDLKLGQPVALKFLPPGFDRDPARLQRFLDEVRTARQVSHANVCRIYDAGEADGQHFLSMEYVDGEDLASLLRRIGRLPKEKAIQIARELCAGLAASHDVGVLHRDLKPSNVMIDGRGRARITDFGLATGAGELDRVGFSAGTPAYMAPEQRAGKEVSAKSDLYALGLVLYELFTGKQATGDAPSTPSSLVEGFDPTVERVIMRCLERDPARRPSSAFSVAAALPGGDPIAAALAAGETPSPEMVAEAGETEAKPAVVWAAFGVFVVAIVAVFALIPRTALLGMVCLDKPPEVLQDRAREIVALTGLEGKRVDSDYVFAADDDYLHDVLHRDGGVGNRWDVLHSSPPSGILFRYRESPAYLEPVDKSNRFSDLNDPPDVTPGMARVTLDPDGRLLTLSVVPGERIASDPPPAPSWDPLLKATGVDPATLAPTQPGWALPVYADHRVAWTARWPGRPDLPVRIEAASAAGRPVALRVILPWTRPAEQPAPPTQRTLVGGYVGAFVAYVMPLFAAIAALRNVRRGRGDRRGALRFALLVGSLRLFYYVGAHHSPAPSEAAVYVAFLASALLRFGIVYVFYLALEPYARRAWPQILVSWVRVLEGRFGDPLVGRDLVLGSAIGAVIMLVSTLPVWMTAASGGTSFLPSYGPLTLDPLRGTVLTLVDVAFAYGEGISVIAFPLTLLLIFRLVLRSTAAAAVVVSLIGGVLFMPPSGSMAAYWVGLVLASVLMWFALFRVGLLAFVTSFFVSGVLAESPLTPHPSGWYVGTMLLMLAAAVAPAVYGLWTSRAVRGVIRLDEDAAGA